MGTPSDPEEPDYEKGDHCEDCKDAIFDGHTPKYVLAVFEGIEICPPNGDSPFNGEYLLEQVPGKPCKWAASFIIDGNFHEITYWAAGGGFEGGSELSFTIFDAPHFESWSATKCVTSFASFNSCPANDEVGGTGVIRWGPDIKP